MEADPIRLKLQAFFASTDADPAAMSKRWDDIWQDDFVPFDRGVANPALDEALTRYLVQDSPPTGVSHATPQYTASSTHSIDAASATSATTVLGRAIDPTTGRRRTALVPGCGRGYDVLLLAAWGFDAVGVEISETAAAAAEALRQRVEAVCLRGEGTTIAPGPNQPADLDAERHTAIYRSRSGRTSGDRGSARFVVGDFFAPDGPASWSWPKSFPLPPDHESAVPLPKSFDLIVDYTFGCAFPPEVRPKWAATMHRLLSADPMARLLCVEFPTYKDPLVRGPPWAMPPEVYMAVLGRPGEGVEYDKDSGKVVLSKRDREVMEAGGEVSDKGFVRVAHYKCQETHKAGKDTDHVGIWRKGGK